MKQTITLDSSTDIIEFCKQTIFKMGKYQETNFGAFSRVFKDVEQGKVVKLAMTVPDVGYQSYIANCLKFQHNPFLPKMHQVIEVKNEFESFTITELELLQSMTGSFGFHDIFDFHAKILTEYIKIYMNGRYSKSELRDIASNLQLKYIEGKEDCLIEACSVILETLKPLRKDRYWESLDLHGNNIMFRVNGDVKELVITDPIA